MKKAFTMIELVFVIVVIGILAATIIPNIQTNPLKEAAIQVVSDIRYAQHLAMVDDKYNKNDSHWFEKRWTVLFNSDAHTDNQESYTVYNDLDANGNPDITATRKEVAVDTLNQNKYMSGGFTGENDLDIRDLDANPANFQGLKKYNIGKSYGVTNVVFSNNCRFNNSTRLAFDHLGRPLIGNIGTYTSAYMNNRILQGQCRITLFNSEGNVTITVEAETGYASIE